MSFRSALLLFVLLCLLTSKLVHSCVTIVTEAAAAGRRKESESAGHVRTLPLETADQISGTEKSEEIRISLLVVCCYAYSCLESKGFPSSFRFLSPVSPFSKLMQTAGCTFIHPVTPSCQPLVSVLQLPCRRSSLSACASGIEFSTFSHLVSIITLIDQATEGKDDTQAFPNFGGFCVVASFCWLFFVAWKSLWSVMQQLQKMQ